MHGSKIVDLENRLAAEEEAKTAASFAKRAEDIGLPEADGDLFRKAYSGDVKAQAEIESMIKDLLVERAA